MPVRIDNRSDDLLALVPHHLFFVDTGPIFLVLRLEVLLVDIVEQAGSPISARLDQVSEETHHVGQRQHVGPDLPTAIFRDREAVCIDVLIIRSHERLSPVVVRGAHHVRVRFQWPVQHFHRISEHIFTCLKKTIMILDGHLMRTCQGPNHTLDIAFSEAARPFPCSGPARSLTPQGIDRYLQYIVAQL
ncbi:hypothetical protein PMAYCL1PPCAC_08781 [Pristionchus mayeri]|uniref:Uncharacterized protein n=1 Tax=Pristionchus mayeri TaxID=1317129 RepID=A0AAN5CEB5_9BILA|nr:hypothetical protein PMAYCL1PPCAC_08781 [Pristionchus mayeri]